MSPCDLGGNYHSRLHPLPPPPHMSRKWACHYSTYHAAVVRSPYGSAVCVTGDWWFPRTKASDAECDVLFDLRLNKRLSKQSWGCLFETSSRPSCRHCNEFLKIVKSFKIQKIEFHKVTAQRPYGCCKCAIKPPRVRSVARSLCPVRTVA